MTAVLSFLVNNKLDPLQCLKPLLDAGFTTPEKISSMTADQVKSTLPKAAQRKLLAVLRKRQRAESTEESPASKHSKSSPFDADIEDHAPKLEVKKPGDKKTSDQFVLINRAPVMILWSVALGCARGFDWDTSLSLAAMVAEGFAKAKGKGLGLYPPDTGEEDPFPQGWQPVMVSFLGKQFKAGQKGDIVRGVTGSGYIIKPSAVLRRLRRAFKDELEEVYFMMKELAAAVAAEYMEAADNAVGYEIYCGFRPDIPKGRAGWGAKGRLEFGKMKIPQADPRFNSRRMDKFLAVKKRVVSAEDVEVLLKKTPGSSFAELGEKLCAESEGLKAVLEQMQMDGIAFVKQDKYYLL